jgi:hypothetical protein
MTQPTGSGSAVPGVAATAGDALTGRRDSATTSRDDQVPVGAADAVSDAVGDDDVPTGAADAEADRRRTTGGGATG